jgi:hypothetical protein
MLVIAHAQTVDAAHALFLELPPRQAKSRLCHRPCLRIATRLAGTVANAGREAASANRYTSPFAHGECGRSRMFITDAVLGGLPVHIAQGRCCIALSRGMLK